ncbi:glutamine-hydrolyzing carbamoyl-phosphate synthase small subunit [Terrilactibacillus sp. BCM23-1]|uniref:Carbamoyl phosphate synthase small chain n=1 Tax=Terrilactibacillus tamarindi TaxID=2599694 RepID=A0A6N8CQV1_9BACI|nr:carbamoyl phosphate synthase small subunit [Terrilactibacillus tamarindi]MTT32038.1 glutamine-hydrolyzing carbamoyl-phosphate synthase small subunit [Terrilactibacillus tamarindi]
MSKQQLILENGTVFVGEQLGSSNGMKGEVVFNTGMTGYQEIMTDPSYFGQIVVLTYPLIGNYGINRSDFESKAPFISGLVVREAQDVPSHWRSEQSLDAFLKSYDIPAIQGIDTRKLTKMIREYGTLRGKICSMDVDASEVVKELNKWELPTHQVSQVTTKMSYTSPGQGRRIVLVDFGMKKGILRECVRRGFDITVVPATTGAEEILNLQPDGVILSNGPGDPKSVPDAIQMVRELLGKTPIFGICLGHQLLALACGANTEKMRFGHRGSNHPVKDLETGQFMLTSQNHGYTVDEKSLELTQLSVTHLAINDQTIEGLKHRDYPAFSVQFHPEASPGPEDSNPLFDKFQQMIEQTKKAGVQFA